MSVEIAKIICRKYNNKIFTFVTGDIAKSIMFSSFFFFSLFFITISLKKLIIKQIIIYIKIMLTKKKKQFSLNMKKNHINVSFSLLLFIL